MTFPELMILLQPLTQFLGTVCLAALAAGSVLLAIVWFIRKTWKLFAAVGLIAAAVLVMDLLLTAA